MIDLQRQANMLMDLAKTAEHASERSAAASMARAKMVQFWSLYDLVVEFGLAL
jgi:hypothetical protein